HHLLGVLLGELHRRVAVAADEVEDLPEQLREVLERRQRYVQHRHVLLQLGRHDERWAQDDGGGVGALERVPQLPDRADDARLLEVAVEVLEDHHRGGGELPCRSEGDQRILTALHRRAAATGAHPAQPLDDAPLVDFLAVPLRKLVQEAVHALLLGADEVEQRVAGPHQRVELSEERLTWIGGRRHAAPTLARLGGRPGPFHPRDGRLTLPPGCPAAYSSIRPSMMAMAISVLPFSKMAPKVLPPPEP